jgi:hypothetical protein
MGVRWGAPERRRQVDRVPARDARANGTGREILRAGAAAGALGGVAMMAFMMAASALDGDSALSPLRAVGTTFRGREALDGGAGTIAWGVAVFVLFGAALGVAFAAAVPRDMRVPSGMVLGAGMGLLAMAFLVRLVIPHVAPALAASMPRHGGAWVIAHAVFGAVTGIAPWLRRRIGGEVRRRAAAPTPQSGPLRPRTST